MKTSFALFGLGGGEIVLILALILILFGARILPNMSKGLGVGIEEFRKHAEHENQRLWRSWGETLQFLFFLVLLVLSFIEVLALVDWLI